MKFTIDLDLKFNDIIPKEEILTIVEDAIINMATNQHIRLLNICRALESNSPSIENKKILEHHATWIELLENSKIGYEHE